MTKDYIFYTALTPSDAVTICYLIFKLWKIWIELEGKTENINPSLTKQTKIYYSAQTLHKNEPKGKRNKQENQNNLSQYNDKPNYWRHQITMVKTQLDKWSLLVLHHPL